MPTEVGESDERVVDAFPGGARIVEVLTPSTAAPRYRFEALLCDAGFNDLEGARLYADVYFAVGSFCEDDTGTRGIPPAVSAAGTDSLAAYLLSRPHTSAEWVKSFFQVDQETLDHFVASVRSRAEAVRSRHGTSQPTPTG